MCLFLNSIAPHLPLFLTTMSIIDIPYEIFPKIFDYLDLFDLLFAKESCSVFRVNVDVYLPLCFNDL